MPGFNKAAFEHTLSLSKEFGIATSAAEVYSQKLAAYAKGGLKDDIKAAETAVSKAQLIPSLFEIPAGVLLSDVRACAGYQEIHKICSLTDKRVEIDYVNRKIVVDTAHSYRDSMELPFALTVYNGYVGPV